MIVATVDERDERIERPCRRQQVERVLDRLRVDQQQRALAEVIERQRGQHEAPTRRAHRQCAEVAHVGVERLGAGDGEHDAAQREESEHADGREETDRIERIERQQHLRRLHDSHDAEPPSVTNHSDHDRAEQCADAAGAALLDREQHDQTTSVSGITYGLKRGRRDLEPFDRREHRDGRRDRAVAVEERRAEEPQQHQHTRARAGSSRRRARAPSAP